ncbi:hypothetical protein GH714_010355 [Hevea brasiliensis]|uniref:Protein kinase domain-containing protein n=1 Tax=Hevea brasiliensis TaxID=3981 RepID=A0A6A6MJ70_HEVBR|nr:hypothetical protein GH714_010355 [Hevea brasiliensis]
MEGESSFSVVAPPVFDGEDYQVWAVRMEPFLDACDLWEAVEEDYEHMKESETVKVYVERLSSIANKEIALLSRLRHPNIVQYYGSETVDDKLYIYLEYVSGGSIYKLLQEYGQFGEIAIRSFTQQILSGLNYLHAKNTVHRDIKGANILLEPSGRVKLADFGMAKHITGQSCPLSLKRSPYWMAPEVIRNSNGCNLAVDIWSLGCTVLEMATAKLPWSQYEGVAVMFKIGNSKELPAFPDNLSDDGKDFVRQCLQRNPSHRPTVLNFWSTLL